VIAALVPWGSSILRRCEHSARRRGKGLQDDSIA
jgi:hypothetical protein